MVLSGRRHGACDALRWNADLALYRCGAMTDPATALQAALPRWLRPVAPRLAAPLARFARRSVAAGTGCDCSLQVSSRATEAPAHDRGADVAQGPG